VEEEVITSEKQRFATYYFGGPANLTIASAMKVIASGYYPRRSPSYEAL
jgi:hypothetical protein